MTTPPLRELYTERSKRFDSELSAVKKKINTISNMRLVVALSLIALLYFGFSVIELFYAAPIVVVLFVVLVKQHSEFFAKKVHLENLVKLNEYELRSLQGDFSNFDSGSRFINPSHHYTHDLDVFGNRSLYQYLCRTCTLNGAERLATSLEHTLADYDTVRAKQQAVKELSNKIEFRQHFWAVGKSVEEQTSDKQQLLEWIKHPAFLYGKKAFGIFLKVFPILTVALVFISFFVDAVSSFAILCALIQWGVLGIYLKRVNAFHEYISRKKYILEKYARLLHLFGNENFESPLMQELKSNAHEADQKVKSLASLVSALDARLNFMTNLVVNSLFLYDLQYIYRLEKWKEENAPDLEKWMSAVSETDMLCSLGTFSFNHQHFVFPTLSSEIKISAVNMGHPLISKEEIVTNDLDFGGEQNVLIITGANMAGKSTFLRTLGVNMILASIGAPVCSSSFTCPLIGMRSGMRTADSLQDHQSYFYAELNRLKSIVDELREGKQLLILLDEILKGTNSTDKQAGSIALVKQLLSYHCLSIIATHDLALGDLEIEYPTRVRNYCFEPTIENDQLTFDYKIRRGLAQKMNATFLMKKMGIIM